ncbi:hypothetical protein NE236_15970 [Actinoallomurus purpureus]|uniref:hypothetical protein n=1 Tax=Actinoallomurus purpureus TaxID=478114 RepID=UPI0020935EE8|nr:hypothetical protein [Actinoallomurus purpureus]MCO6006483.1 hypothetical protein [Actinoallomurus purpureus]
MLGKAGIAREILGCSSRFAVTFTEHSARRPHPDTGWASRAANLAGLPVSLDGLLEALSAVRTA